MALQLIPQSIRGRLFLAALVFTGFALVFASLSIGEVLDRFIRRGLNERLDAQIALLARTIQPDGSIDRQMLGDIAPFTQTDFGWRWRIDTPRGTISSTQIVPTTELRRRPSRGDRVGKPRSETSRELYARTLTRQANEGMVRITVAVPKFIIDRMREAAVRPLLISLTALGAFLLIATLLQLRIGLRPLSRLKAALSDVRGGELDRIPGDQPMELREVVNELNGLLDENEAALARARGHLANLAHSLKTPLATLSLRLGEPGRDPDGALADLVAQIDRGIRHHLGRARAASPGAPGQPQVNIASAIWELVGVLGRIHAEREISVDVEVPTELSANCDPQDLDEMLGNLLDNGWKCASSRIDVNAAADGNLVRILIDDDGPGLSEEAIDQALVPGRRLDERGDGHGFGLSIARELVELHGGSLHLGPSPLGGLRVTLALPA